MPTGRLSVSSRRRNCESVNSKKRIDVTLTEVQRLGIGPNKTHIVQESTRTFLAMPVCCLADIPIMHLGYHANRYGKIAIGYHRESVLQAGFSPVFYQLHNSIALQSLFQTIFCLDIVCGFDPAYDSGADSEAKPEGESSDEHYEQFTNRMRAGALTQAKKSAVKLAAFIKTFEEREFSSIYTEREWRSISPFNFEHDDISMIALPRSKGDGNYFERFVEEAKSIPVPPTVSIVAWDDLVEH